VADQLAADGFIAVAPDLLSGMGPGGGGTDSFAGDAAREAIRRLTPDQVAQRLDAVRKHALALPAASAKSASLGFCWGGTASFRYASRQMQLNAAVVYYGSGPTTEQELASINCPILGLYGGDDARVTSTVELSAAGMNAAGKSFESHVFDGAGHGFLRQQSARDGANQRAANAAWKRTVEFLHEHLR
jgi:carboxymethylenebutenolidase